MREIRFRQPGRRLSQRHPHVLGLKAGKGHQLQTMLARKYGHILAAEVASCPGYGLALHFGIKRRRSPKLAAHDAARFEHTPSLTQII